MGKTAVIYEAARRLSAGKCPEPLQGRAVWQTDALQLVAGQKYIGEWQGQLRAVCAELEASGGRRCHPAGRGSGAALVLHGANVYSFLAGEAGLHQETSLAEGDERADVARVVVLPLDEAAAAAPPAALQELAAQAAPSGDLVRIYSLARERFVRDPRTDLRLNRVKDVLEGRLDDFLLAYLRLRGA